MHAPEHREHGRIMALDVGRKRIGVAVTDELGIMAHGLPSLVRTKPRQDLARLTAMARERNVRLFLIGLPLHMTGAESEQAAYTRDFGRALEARSGIPVQFRDERLTSYAAEQHFRESGARYDRRAGDIDRVAAVILLEDYLASQGPAPSVDGIGS